MPIDTNTMLIDVLIEVVSGERPSDKRALAVEILKYIRQQQTTDTPLPTCLRVF